MPAAPGSVVGDGQQQARQGTRTIRSKLIAGYGAVFVLMAVWLIFSLAHMDKANTRLAQVVDINNKKTQLIYMMRLAIRERLITLHRMIIIPDLLDRDEEWMRYKELASSVIEARNALEGLLSGVEERAVFEHLTGSMESTARFQRQITELAMDGKMDMAVHKLRYSMDAQEAVIADIDRMLSFQQTVNRRAALAAAESYRAARTWLFIIGAVITAVGFAIAFYIVRAISAQALSLQREQHRFKTLYEGIQSSVLLFDEHGVLDCNPVTLERFGCRDRAEIVGRHWLDLSPPVQEDGTASADQLANYLRAARNGHPQRFAWQFKRGAEGAFPADVTLQTVHVDGAAYLQAVVHDVTERKLAQRLLEEAKQRLELKVGDQAEELAAAHQQLLQSEKMASLGQLAAGVAHEINNPIGYVGSNLASLKEYVVDLVEMLELYRSAPPGSPEQGHLLGQVRALEAKVDFDFAKQDLVDLIQESMEGIDRVRKIVLDLKGFSHVDETDWQWVDVHDCFDSTLNIVYSELKYKAEVIKEFAELPEIECMPSQINQVILNLLVNAAQAIEQEGVITLRTGCAGADEVWLEVEDNGAGIEEAHLNKIFDPFFTTKPVGKGTGLGLSLSFGIIKVHKGRIEVDSEPGRGTRFRVYLPIHRAHEAQPEDREPATPRLRAV